MRHLFLTLFFVMSVFTSQAQAQSQQEGSSPQPDRSALLPDIDPQDIEIRGDFRARFAGIARQPILGFSPNPRVFRIDPNRMPFMETPEEVVASVPLSELEPQLGPPRVFMEYPSESNIFGYIGLGNYVSPEAAIAFRTGSGSATRVSGMLNWQSSEGVARQLDGNDFALPGNDFAPEYNTSFRFFNGNIDLFSQRTPTSGITASLRGRSDFTNLTTSLYSPSTAFNPRNTERKTSLDEAGISVGWINQRSVFDRFSADISYDGTFMDSEASGTAWVEGGASPINSEFDFTEHRAKLSLARSWAGSRIGDVFSTELNLDGALYNRKWDETVFESSMGSDIDEQWGIGEASFVWRRELTSGNRISAGLRFFTAYDDVQDAVVMAYPYLGWQLRNAGPLSITAEISGEISNPGLSEMATGNRTTWFADQLLNERMVYGNIRAQYSLFQDFEIYGGFLASYTLRPHMYTSIGWANPEYLLLIRPSAGITYHLSPKLLSIYADVRFNITEIEEFRASDGATYTEFTGMERYRVTAGLRSTPFQNAVFRVWADYLGPRYHTNARFDRGQIFASQADGFGDTLLMHVQAEYRISGLVGFYVKAVNLLNNEYRLWENYDERPLQIYGGVTFNF
ncbi:MAG: hypothetical protein LAT67_10205 [Balneolales bacterium]|nr:hypothetical protein [Balneolales bacterium]